MSDLFKQLNSICFKNKLPKEYIEDEYIGNYMMIKWLSCIETTEKTSYALHKILNEVNNYISESKYTQYCYLYHTFPKVGSVKYDYIKKAKGKKAGVKELREMKINEECVKFLAQALEISEREAKYFVDNDQIDKNQILMTK